MTLSRILRGVQSFVEHASKASRSFKTHVLRFVFAQWLPRREHANGVSQRPRDCLCKAGCTPRASVRAARSDVRPSGFSGPVDAPTSASQGASKMKTYAVYSPRIDE